MTNVAFIGPIGSGKTTMCNALVERVGGTRIGFAFALKEECAIALMGRVVGKWTPDVEAERLDATLKELPREIFDVVMYGNLDEVIDLLADPGVKHHFRSLQQWWGTEYRRAQDEDYWVKQLVGKVRGEGNFFVDDCRYPNEYDALRAAGFKFALLDVNPDFPRDPKRDAHSSEQHWPTFETDIHILWDSVPARLDFVLELFDQENEGRVVH